MSNAQTYICQQCGKEFQGYPRKGAPRRFCCKECYLASVKANTYVCEYCGKEFKSYRKYETLEKQPKTRFCCKEHYFKYVHEAAQVAANELNATCKNCGKKFHASASALKKDMQFCSISCSSQYTMRERNKKYREDLNCTCNHCGKKFHKKPSAIGTLNFCSKDCREAYHKARRVKIVCQTCGKEFDAAPSDAKTKKFCSVKCHDEYQRRFFIETKCAYCGKPLKVSLTVQSHNKTGQYFCNNKCVGKFFQRENSPNYKGTANVMKVLRMYFGKYQRTKIFERDNGVCQICGATADHVHHIYPVSKMIKDFQKRHPDIDLTKNCYQVADMIIQEQPKFLDSENMIAICEHCHKSMHSAKNKKVKGV